MQPQFLHLNHPYQDALIVGGVILVLLLTVLLIGNSGYSDAEVRSVANQSETVSTFLSSHPDAEVTVTHTADRRYTVQYTAPGASLTATVDMAERQVIRTERETVN